MPAENAKLHKKVAAYKSVVKVWNISNESLPRVYRILDALFRQVEILEGSINDDLSFQIRNEHVSIYIAEAQDEIKHELGIVLGMPCVNGDKLTAIKRKELPQTGLKKPVLRQPLLFFDVFILMDIVTITF